MKGVPCAKQTNYHRRQSTCVHSNYKLSTAASVGGGTEEDAEALASEPGKKGTTGRVAEAQQPR